MEQGLQTNENKGSIALSKISQTELTVAIRSNQFAAASALMPTKIEKVFNEPKVFELVQAIGQQSVKRQIEFELVNLAMLMSVGGNLNDAQVTFIADQLVNLYPTESIADFKICFQRGAIGSYGPIQRMDGITIREWMAKYLEEKYLIAEDMLMKEKDDLYKVPTLTQIERNNLNSVDVNAMIEDYKQSIKQFEARAILPLSEKEIKEEGQERPKRKVYVYDETEAGIKLKEVHSAMFAGQEKTVRERHPEWSEEQIQQRCEELRSFTIKEETKPKFSTDIGKIWEKKNRKERK